MMPVSHEATLKAELKAVHAGCLCSESYNTLILNYLDQLVEDPRQVLLLFCWVMKREDLARRLARETRQTRAEAQDQVDALVHRILRTLRAGKPVELPGLGKLVIKKTR